MLRAIQQLLFVYLSSDLILFNLKLCRWCFCENYDMQAQQIIFLSFHFHFHVHHTQNTAGIGKSKSTKLEGNFDSTPRNHRRVGTHRNISGKWHIFPSYFSFSKSSFTLTRMFLSEKKEAVKNE
jgi:hypothetical protein